MEGQVEGWDADVGDVRVDLFESSDIDEIRVVT
jgi:hypothetical protein